MCGEKTGSKGETRAELGSPPHVRGKALGGKGCITAVRITPACAGKRQLYKG